MVGLMLSVGIIAVALFGSYAAPHGANDLVSAPYQAPSSEYPLGTDFLGRDVLSRVLIGGHSLVFQAALATVLAYLIGGSIGLAAGYSRSLVDPTLMRTMDVLLAFPPLLFLLILATALGPGAVMAVTGVAVVLVPGVARVVRAATMEVSVRGYVEIAVTYGERTPAVLAREVLPNIRNVLVAAVVPSFTYSIVLIASLSFLGLGAVAPATDWGSMISENRFGLELQPWAVVVPAALIAGLAIGVDLVAGSVVRSEGHRVEDMLPRR
jgi:ABC-type dipeptide/oligopeptide/nickel transport system permease subunit